MRHPEVSYSDHSNLHALLLGQSIAPLRKIYLDTKFWVDLRDAKTGRTNDTDLQSLLDLLARLVASDRAICPLSTEIFREIFRQSDPTTLRCSVALIDQLSRGICLLEHFARIRVEAFHFVRQATHGAVKVHPLSHLVWTKAAYVLGHVMPTFSDAALTSQGIDVAIQKAFFDQLWETTLTDLLVISEDEFRIHDDPDISEPLNEGKFANLNDYRSFSDLFLIELKGVLDACRPAFADVMQDIYHRDTGNIPTEQELASDKSGDWIANLIYECFRLGKVSKDLPTIRMEASLHAAVRWDKSRRYKRTDCADFRHASAAVPYFDYFLTERSLGHLLSDGNLALQQHFGCIVVRDAADALEVLAKLEP